MPTNTSRTDLLQIKKGLTNEQVFTSESIIRYFESMASVLTKRFHSNAIQVFLLWVDKKPVAYTDYSQIVIHLKNPLLFPSDQPLDRQTVFDLIRGLFAHELGHILFTNQKGYSKFYQKFKYSPNSYKVVKEVANIIEDAAIEPRMMERYPGILRYSLAVLRKRQLDRVLPLEQLLELESQKKVTTYAVLRDMLLSYAKYGKIKHDPRDKRSMERLKLFAPVMEWADGAVCTGDFFCRCRYIEQITEFMKKYFKREQEQDASWGAELLSNSAPLLGDNSEITPVNQSSRQELQNELKGVFVAPDDSSDSEAQDLDEQCSSDEKSSCDSKLQLEQIINDSAQQIQQEKFDRDLLNQIQNLTMDLDAIHQNIQLDISRPEKNAERYRYLCKEVSPVIRSMIRQFQQNLFDYQSGGKFTGLPYGKHLDSKRFAQEDKKFFYNKKLPNDLPMLAISFLLDESGSMEDEHRIDYCQKAAIIFSEFCSALDIPISIYGHSTRMKKVDLFIYQDFEGVSSDKYRLSSIRSRNGNRDGLPLGVVINHLLKRPEEVKLLFLISDGCPNHLGYCGKAATKDLQGLAAKCRRKGIIFVAAGIGQDRKPLREIYGSHYMDISNLNLLAKQIIRVIQKYLPY